MTKKRKILLWLFATFIVLAALGTTWWIKHFRTYTPAAVAMDLKAAIAVRHLEQPVPQFMELRYGPMTEPDNRQRAFLDFFDPGHMEGLYIIVGHMKGPRKQANINAMAQWVTNYRDTMTPQERETLRAYLNTDAGKNKIHTATANYLKKEVDYRASTAPVITALMSTLAAVEYPNGKTN